MKNIHEVIRQKEEDMARIEQELAALRLAAELLSEHPEERPQSVFTMPPATSRQEAPVLEGTYNSPWGNAPKQFP